MILLIGLVTKNSILLVEYINQLKERGLDTVSAALEAGRIRLRPILMTSVATIMGALPIALGLGAGSLSRRPLGLRHRGRPPVLHRAHPVRGAGRLRALRRRPGPRPAQGPEPAPGAGPGGGGVMLALFVALQAVAADTVPAQDTVPQVTLSDALRRSAQLDPDYVQALGRIDNAEWARRAAMLTFILPSVSVGLDETKYSQDFFNPANPAVPTSTLVVGRASANYEIFSVRKFAELGRTKAELASAEAGEVEQRFQAALETESSYYDVLVNQELKRVADERVARAQEGLGVARARVSSGAAVPTDSLQLVLELTRAQVDVLRQQNALRTARLDLGRRVGVAGPVDAAPLDSAPAPQLPITLPEAVRSALDQGPQYQAAQADERAAESTLKSQRSDYLPTLSIGGLHQRYDTQIFPGAANISSLTFSVSFPLWNDGQREIAASQARVDRDVARAIRQDLEGAVRRDVTRAYDGYDALRAAVELAGVAVTVARETYRMQQLRYRAGAGTILDFLDAQVNLAQSEADLVQARYQTRLALAGLEAILGRRLFSGKPS